MAPHYSESRILNAVLRKLCDDEFKAAIPDSLPRKEWRKIRRWKEDKHENERLETVGDAMLWTCLSLRLYEYKETTPAVITKLRSVLLSNLVLALLAEKSDKKLPYPDKSLSILNVVNDLLLQDECGKKVKVAIPKSRFKSTADKYEAAAGALFVSQGLVCVRSWFNATFDPLIAAALDSNSTFHSQAGSSGARARLDAQGSVETQASGSQRKGKVKARMIIPDNVEIIDLTGDDYFEEDEAPQPDDDGPIFIDLTGDSDDEDADELIVTKIAPRPPPVSPRHRGKRMRTT